MYYLINKIELIEKYLKQDSLLSHFTETTMKVNKNVSFIHNLIITFLEIKKSSYKSKQHLYCYANQLLDFSQEMDGGEISTNIGKKNTIKSS